jgi:hypothetical protein
MEFRPFNGFADARIHITDDPGEWARIVTGCWTRACSAGDRQVPDAGAEIGHVSGGVRSAHAMMVRMRPVNDYDGRREKPSPEVDPHPKSTGRH